MIISKRKVLTIGLLVWAVLAVIGFQAVRTPEPPVAPPSPPPAVVQEPITVEDLHRLVNEERAKAGVKPLELNPLLNKSAQMKADEMNLEGLDDTPHVNNAGKRGIQYIFEQKIPNCYTASENLSWSHQTPTDVINGWMGSPSHRDAILDPKNDQIGYGVAGEYVAQHFCDL